MDLLGSVELRDAALEPALQLGALERPGDVGGDRRQEPDIAVAEVAGVVGLDIQHADEPIAGDDRYRAHRHEPVLIDLWQPPKPRLDPNIRDHDRGPRLRRPARHPVTNP